MKRLIAKAACVGIAYSALLSGLRESDPIAYYVGLVCGSIYIGIRHAEAER